jgi:Ca-activated chloride channel family protein
LTENGTDRIVLASDGVANVGLTDPDSILEEISRDAAAGIELVSVGVGMGNYNDTLLERLADQGDGFYAYVNTADEAHRLFSEQLTGTLETVALDARAQVVFDPRAVRSYRLIGYENRSIPDGQFRNDGVPAGAIGAGHAVTALYALRLDGELARGDSHVADVRLRWTDPTSQQATEMSRKVTAADLASSFEATRPEFRLDAIVSATAQLLHGTELGTPLDLRDVAEFADRQAERLPATDEVRSFLDLLRDVSRLRS